MTATLVGAGAAAAAVAWYVLGGDLLAGVSIGFAFIAVVLGMIAVLVGAADECSRRTRLTVAGLALGVITLGHWIWLASTVD